MPAEIPDEILNSLSHWEEKRKNRDNEVTLADYVLSLKNKIIELDIKTENMNLKKITAGKGIDLWLRKDNIEYIFDIKTNQINQNGGLSLNRNLMDQYTFRILQNPNVEVYCKITFPFNPFGNTDWWTAQGSRVYPLQPIVDAVVENEFWDFLSGEKNTWECIQQIFDELGKNNFGNKFSKIFYE